ncbi:unnamed protein product [Dracunculus medinensis]|uniref:ShKT domain-containing protein n=1 Tax=Dracunculus medinensis TaxID=318479 RepID=A0A0N4US43_DRAME|nr:unnamed protein product [Dracunculus medinensis]
MHKQTGLFLLKAFGLRYEQLLVLSNVEIEECVKLVGNDHKKRPTVDFCPEDPACSSIFPYDLQTEPNVLANNLRENEHYKIPELCNKVKDFAAKTCPRTCAMCCKTKEFNCHDVNPDACRRLDRNICLTVPSVALSMCPFTCGLCHRPGAAGMCPDENENCAAIFHLDPTCSTDFMKRSCKKTCRLTDCLPGNSTSNSSTCTDLHPQCQANARYCNIGDYAVVMSRVCRLTCRHCTP